MTWGSNAIGSNLETVDGAIKLSSVAKATDAVIALYERSET